MKSYHVTITSLSPLDFCETEIVRVVEAASSVAALLVALDSARRDDSRINARVRLADSLTARECLSDCDCCRAADAAGELAR